MVLRSRTKGPPSLDGSHSFILYLFRADGFQVQGSEVLPVALAFNIDKDLRYATLPTRCKAAISAMKTEAHNSGWFGVFQPGTLNPEPHNLGLYL